MVKSLPFNFLGLFYVNVDHVIGRPLETYSFVLLYRTISKAAVDVGFSRCIEEISRTSKENYLGPSNRNILAGPKMK